MVTRQAFLSMLEKHEDDAFTGRSIDVPPRYNPLRIAVWGYIKRLSHLLEILEILIEESIDSQTLASALSSRRRLYRSAEVKSSSSKAMISLLCSAM